MFDRNRYCGYMMIDLLLRIQIGPTRRMASLRRRRSLRLAGQPKKFFEFKSYGPVPPTNFDTQFINDLNNPEITDLSQLKWFFDAAKNPANFETGEAGLRALLDQNFTSIIKLK